MKTKNLLTILVTLFSMYSIGQTTGLVWAYNIKNTKVSQYNFAYDMVIDNTGNFYVTGTFQYSVDIDPSAGTTIISEVSTGSNDIYLAKYNSSGALIWVKTIGSTGDETAMDLFLANNTIYMCGYFNYSPLDFDPGPGTYTLSPGINKTAFAATYDLNGNFLSAFNIDSYSMAHSISADNAGNIYLTGEFAGLNVDFDPGTPNVPLTSQMNSSWYTWDMFYAKYTPAGSCVWAKSIGSPVGSTCCNGEFADYGSCIAVNNINGDVAIGGQLGGGGRLLLVNSAGTTLRNMNFVNVGTGTGAAFDNTGNLYFSGDYGWNNTTEDFDWNATTFNLTSGSTYGHGFVVKYNSSYNLVWATKITSIMQYFRNLELELDNNEEPLIVGGEASSAAVSNIQFAKLDKNSGTVLWKNVLSGVCPGPGSGLNQTYGYGIGYSPTDGNVVVVGVFGGVSSNTTACSLDADPGSGVYNLNQAFANSSQCEIFLGKYGTCAGAPSAPASISGLNTICVGTSASTYSVASVSGASSYIWSLPGGWTGSSTTNTISVTSGTSSGTISVSATNSCGSSTASILSITVSPTPTLTVNSGSICSGSSFTMTPSGASTYTFSSGSATVSPASSTNYSVTGTSSAGCIGSNTAVSSVVVNATPTISVNSGSICAGQSFTIVPAGASTYTYSGGSAIVSPASTASYSVTGTSGAGCVSVGPAVSTVSVTSLPFANAGSSQSITCINSFVNLNGSGVSSYTWSGPGIVSGGNSANPLVNSAGTYSLIGSNAGCNSANTATVLVISNTTPPGVSVTATSNTLCAGSSLTLTASGASTYSWSTSSTNTTIIVNPTVTTNYILSGTNTANGCTNSTNQSITIYSLPTVIASTSSSLICGPPFQGTVTLTGSGASTYTWNTSSTTNSISVSPGVTTSYTVTGTDANGCVNTASITQVVSACTGIDEVQGTIGEVQVYPNPTTGKITIMCPPIEVAGKSIEICNSLGEIIIRTKIENEKTEIDLGDLASGIYFIKTGTISKKIVKQ